MPFYVFVFVDVGLVKKEGALKNRPE